MKLKRLSKCILLGVILGIILSFTVAQYQSDRYDINLRIAQIQQQQEILVIGTGNPLPILIKKVMPSVVYVRVPERWSGSGVIVGPHTVLIAGHVIKDITELYIETADGKRYNAISWVEDKKNDCGLIFFDPREEFKDISEFADSNLLQVGDIVFTMGSPFGKILFNTVTFGIISGLNRDISYFGDCGLITSDAAGNPGNSGGPVFDMRGKVIGIVVGRRYGSEGLNIIIPSNICQKLLENKEKDNVEINEADETTDTP